MSTLEVEKSRIFNPIDFDKDGRQAGYLRAPLSRNTSGWGVVEIPVITIKNGSGPTVLLTGGIHGDEYEAQVYGYELSEAEILDSGKAFVEALTSLDAGSMRP